MGLIKEPLNVDFYTSGKEMTAEDQKRVSEYINKKKEQKKKKLAANKSRIKTTSKIVL